MRWPENTAAMPAPSIAGNTVGTGSTVGGVSRARDRNKERIGKTRTAKLAQESADGNGPAGNGRIGPQIDRDRNASDPQMRGLLAVFIREVSGEVRFELAVVGMD